MRANCVAFGWIQTRLTAAKEDGASIEINGKKVALGIPGKKGASDVNATADIPLRRPGEPSEAAAPLLFMASPLASYVSGQTLEVSCCCVATGANRVMVMLTALIPRSLVVAPFKIARVMLSVSQMLALASYSQCHLSQKRRA